VRLHLRFWIFFHFEYGPSHIQQQYPFAVRMNLPGLIDPLKMAPEDGLKPPTLSYASIRAALSLSYPGMVANIRLALMSSPYEGDKELLL
jgi:hypothetical protein